MGQFADWACQPLPRRQLAGRGAQRRAELLPVLAAEPGLALGPRLALAFLFPTVTPPSLAAPACVAFAAAHFRFAPALVFLPSAAFLPPRTGLGVGRGGGECQAEHGSQQGLAGHSAI